MVATATPGHHVAPPLGEGEGERELEGARRECEGHANSTLSPGPVKEGIIQHGPGVLVLAGFRDTHHARLRGRETSSEANTVVLKIFC